MRLPRLRLATPLLLAGRGGRLHPLWINGTAGTSPIVAGGREGAVA